MNPRVCAAARPVYRAEPRHRRPRKALIINAPLLVPVAAVGNRRPVGPGVSVTPANKWPLRRVLRSAPRDRSGTFQM